MINQTPFIGGLPEQKIAILALPEEVVTRDGAVFNPQASQWHIAAAGVHHHFNFELLDGKLHAALLQSFKRVLIDHLKRLSAVSAHNAFRFFYNWQLIEGKPSQTSLTAAQFINLQQTFKQTNGHLTRVGTIASFLRRWKKMRLWGLGEDLCHLLDEIVLAGNVKGQAVATMDPIKGPFSDMELELLQQRLNEAYHQGKVSLDIFVAVWLLMGIGMRPSQLLLLKLKDYKPANQAEDRPALLAVPRTKQRGQRVRSAYRYRKISDALIPLIEKQVQRVRQQAALYGVICEDEFELPLFPDFEVRDRQSEGFTYHQEGSRFNHQLKQAFSQLKILSERTGKQLHINAYRFRYTMATRACRMGAGELVLAELLDHSDTQHVKVYTQSSPEMLERIDRALALRLAPIAQAFAGQLVGCEKDAVRGNSTSSRIYNPEASTEPLGTCGSYSWCGLWAGLACYTCPMFQAWKEGPHEAVLAWLIEKRQHRLDRSDEPHIVQFQDRTILAVAHVIHLCEKPSSISLSETEKQGG